MSKRLPSRSNLDQLRNQAKDLLKSCRTSSSDAIGRFRKFHPSLTDPDPETFGDRVGLQDAQLVTAREYGFQSWRALAARVAETEHRQVLIDHIHANRQQEAIDVLRAHGFIEEDLKLALAQAACYSRFEVADALIERGADPNGDYPGGNFGPILLAACEFLNRDGIRYLVEQGARVNIPERDTAYTPCNTPLKMVLGTYDRRTDRRHACLDVLLEKGAEYDDGPFLDIMRGDVGRLSSRIDEDAGLATTSCSCEFANYLSLSGVTLLHLAAEFNEREVVDHLLDRGADLNARAELDDRGIGSQTPLFHVIGNNQGRCYDLFEHFTSLDPDLAVVARIQAEVFYPGYHPHREASGEVLELTPLGYAERYEHEPSWREASREVKRLREAE